MRYLREPGTGYKYYDATLYDTNKQALYLQAVKVTRDCWRVVSRFDHRAVFALGKTRQAAVNQAKHVLRWQGIAKSKKQLLETGVGKHE